MEKNDYFHGGFMTNLLIVSLIIFACVLLSRISGKLGIPILLSFIVLGMLFGSDGIFKIHFDNYSFAENICSVALIFIMFYGGFGTNVRYARNVAIRAVLLSTVGVLVTFAITGVFCHFALRMNLVESFLIGALISSTDAASVFSILRSKKLNLKYNTASMLEIESGSNDPCAYMLTATMIAIAKGGASVNGIALLIVKQVFLGLLFGGVIAAASYFILKKVRFSIAGFDMIFVVGIALAGYAIPQAFSGNGYLSVYIVGIVIGNMKDIYNKRNLVNFFDGTTGLMQVLIFFLLGLLSFPSRIPAVVGPALLTGLFIMVVARPVAVFLVMLPFKSKLKQILLVSFAGLRGASSIVFAIFAVLSVNTDNDIFHFVFFIVLFSILFQGSLLPLVARKLGMIDTKADVMKTFNDYAEEVPVQFIQVDIPKEHSWCDRKIKDIVLPPQTLIVLLKRNGENIIPNGDTLLLPEDTLILSAISPEQVDGITLSEILIDEGSRYLGKKLSEIPKKEGSLVIMIMRDNSIVIPNGSISLEEGDTIVVI